MRESWRSPDRVPRAPVDSSGGGSSDESQEKAPNFSLAEWTEQIKAHGNAPRLPDVKGKKQKSEVAQLVGEQAMASVIGKYKARDPIGFETALKTYAQGRARKADENSAFLAAGLKLNEEDIQEFKRVIPIVNERLERIGAVEPPKPMTEEELLKGLEGLSPQPPVEPSVSSPEIVAQTQEPSTKQVEEAQGSEVNIEEVFAKFKKMSAESDDAVPPEKKLKHASGTADDDEKILAESHQPVDEEPDIVRKNSPWIAARERKIAQAHEKSPREKRELEKVGEADTREGRIAREVIRFNELARVDTNNAIDIYRRTRDALPEADRDLFREQVIKTGWNVNGEVHQESAEEPEPEPRYRELLPLKTRRDMEREFGEPAGKVNGIPFWVLEDGDAALVSPSSEHAQRIGQNGYLKLKGEWYEFKEENFSTITEQEAKRRSSAIEFRPMTPEEKGRLRDGVPPVDPYAQQLSEDEGQAPPVESPEEAERYGNIDPVLGEVRTERGVSDAQKDFARLFTAPEKLAEAYHAAVQGLSAVDRDEFNEDLYAGYPELRTTGEAGGSELTKVINNELRTNPPPKAETIVTNPETGVSKAYSVFRKKYAPEDRSSLAHAYRDAVRGLTPAERDEFDDALENIVDVPSSILVSMINEERKSNPPKEKGEQRQNKGRQQNRPRQQQQQRGRGGGGRNRR